MFRHHLYRLHGEHVHLIVFLVKSALMDFFQRLDVKFVFALNVFHIFFDFGEIGGKRGPALGLRNRPEPDATGINPDGGHKGTKGVPLRYVSRYG
jgi:hypothetical protein